VFRGEMRKVSARSRTTDPARGNLISPSMQMGKVELIAQR